MGATIRGNKGLHVPLQTAVPTAVRTTQHKHTPKTVVCQVVFAVLIIVGRRYLRPSQIDTSYSRSLAGRNWSAGSASGGRPTRTDEDGIFKIPMNRQRGVSRLG